MAKYMTQEFFNKAVTTVALTSHIAGSDPLKISQLIFGRVNKSFADPRLIEDVAHASKKVTKAVFAFSNKKMLVFDLIQLEYWTHTYEVSGQRRRPKIFKLFNGTLLNYERALLESKVENSIVMIMEYFHKAQRGEIPTMPKHKMEIRLKKLGLSEPSSVQKKVNG